NVNDALSGYALANFSTSPANLTLTLRDKSGATRDTDTLTFAAGQHKPEFAFQRPRFAAIATSGFEGTIEVASDIDIAAVALRYDNTSLPAAQQVFSTIPVIAGDAANTVYFPQFADGGGYRTNFILVNASDASTSAHLEFFASDGSPASLPIGG